MCPINNRHYLVTHRSAALKANWTNMWFSFSHYTQLRPYASRKHDTRVGKLCGMWATSPDLDLLAFLLARLNWFYQTPNLFVIRSSLKRHYIFNVCAMSHEQTSRLNWCINIRKGVPF